MIIIWEKELNTVFSMKKDNTILLIAGLAAIGAGYYFYMKSKTPIRKGYTITVPAPEKITASQYYAQTKAPQEQSLLSSVLSIFKKKPTVVKITETTKPPEKTAKEIANEKGEAYVNIISMEIDPNDMQNGSFELDWNDKFVADLVRHGYQMDPRDTDADIVDRWFTAVCRNVVLETYEQYEAMNNRVVKSRDVGDGFSEVS